MKETTETKTDKKARREQQLRMVLFLSLVVLWAGVVNNMEASGAISDYISAETLSHVELLEK